MVPFIKTKTKIAENPEKNIEDIFLGPNNPINSQSLFINAQEAGTSFTLQDLSFAQKITTGIPQSMADSFVRFKRSNLNGIHVKINDGFWDNLEKEKESQTVRASDYFGYEGAVLHSKLVSSLDSKKNCKFEDDLFPASLSSLITNSLSLTNNNWRKLKWVRLSDIYKSHK